MAGHPSQYPEDDFLDQFFSLTNSLSAGGRGSASPGMAGHPSQNPEDDFLDQFFSLTNSLSAGGRPSGDQPISLALSLGAAADASGSRGGLGDDADKAERDAVHLPGLFPPVFGGGGVQPPHLRPSHPPQPMNILGTKPADPLAEIIPTGSTSKQQQEGMSGAGSTTPDANAGSFLAGTSWGTPPTEPLSMAQYLSHEMLPIGNYKHSCAAELWRALADLAEPLLSIPPAAAEELRRIHRGVTESSARAKERAKALHGYIQKLEKYQSDLVWQRQRTRLGFHHRMTFQELRRITDGFSEKRLLGKGGFGMVYRGVLDDGEVIAVKKLNPQQGLTGDSFTNEIQNLMRVQHQNIISLVGYCEETRDRVVEYEGKLVAAVEIDRAICLEYMPGGTLEKLLSDESSGLDWEARYRIIKGTCQGLQHLHTGSENPIYHLDLNPANILLDKDQIPKIGDFGLSRLLASPATFVTKTNSGTLGYMPPEYMHGQQISSKFDVFSLGIVIIKVIAGPDGYFKYKCIYTSPKKFMDHVTQNWSKRVQARKMSAVSLQKVKKCIKMALRCVEDDRAKRPTITEVVKELNMIS